MFAQNADNNYGTGDPTNMVHNPIYDGPVYDCIQQQKTEWLTATTTDCSPTEEPPQLHCQSHFRSSAPDSGNTPFNTSVSIPTARKMALKKNGMERNKLHLALTLNGNDASDHDSYIDMTAWKHAQTH